MSWSRLMMNLVCVLEAKGKGQLILQQLCCLWPTRHSKLTARFMKALSGPVSELGLDYVTPAAGSKRSSSLTFSTSFRCFTFYLSPLLDSCPFPPPNFKIGTLKLVLNTESSCLCFLELQVDTTQPGFTAYFYKCITYLPK